MLTRIKLDEFHLHYCRYILVLFIYSLKYYTCIRIVRLWSNVYVKQNYQEQKQM